MEALKQYQNILQWIISYRKTIAYTYKKTSEVVDYFSILVFRLVPPKTKLRGSWESHSTTTYNRNYCITKYEQILISN